MVSVTTTLTISPPKRPERENEGHVPSDERINQPNTPTTRSKPAQSKPMKVAKTFQRLLEDVDNGNVQFPDDLEAARFPPQIKEPELSMYSMSWQAKSRDGNNLLHYAVREEIETEEQGEAVYRAVNYRISFVKWLLKSDPHMFMDKNDNEEQPLSYVLGKYPVGKDVTARPTTPTDPDLQRALTHYFLSDKTLKDNCIEILNAKDKREFRCTLHAMIKKMGVEITPYLELGLFNAESLKSKDKDDNTPLHIALEVQHWKSWEKAEDRAGLIALLIKLEDAALTHKNGTIRVKDNLRMAPYAYHMAKCVEFHTKEDGKGCTGQACKDVEFILKDALINLPEKRDGMKHIVRKAGTQGTLKNKLLYIRLCLSNT
jgi:ankyrin repeat protein